MRQELCNKLTARFKFLCNFGMDGKRYNFVPKCGDGWFNLIWSMCIEVEQELLKEYNTLEYTQIETKFVIHEIKEKWGAMSVFCMLGGTKNIYDIINKYEVLSERICEICGLSGRTVKVNGWYTTLCIEHYLREVRSILGAFKYLWPR
jgi:hypothetical protein